MQYHFEKRTSNEGFLLSLVPSSVQVDAQSILDCMGGGNGGVPAVSRAYEEGLCHSVQASFQVKILLTPIANVVPCTLDLFVIFQSCSS